MKYLLVVFILFFSIGCKAIGTNGRLPTPQQLQSARDVNAGLAFGARLAYNIADAEFATRHNAALTKIPLTDGTAIAKENSRYSKLKSIENLVPPLLDQLDAAASGDPVNFHDLLRQEAVMLVTIYLEERKP
jgi:hypothetical protein